MELKDRAAGPWDNRTPYGPDGAWPTSWTGAAPGTDGQSRSGSGCSGSRGPAPHLPHVIS